MALVPPEYAWAPICIPMALVPPEYAWVGIAKVSTTGAAVTTPGPYAAGAAVVVSGAVMAVV